MSSDKNENLDEKRSDPLIEPSLAEKAFINEYLALATDGILIKKGSITTRMFSMANGSTILAFVFSELPDSFIVGLPANMVSNNGVISAKTIAPVSMMRLYKHQFGISAIPIPRFLLPYLSMAEPILDTIPGFFDEARKIQVSSLITALKEIVKTPNSSMEETVTEAKGGMVKEVLRKMATMDNMSNMSDIMEQFETMPDTRPSRSRNLKH